MDINCWVGLDWVNVKNLKLLGVRDIPWARANLNHAAHALIISTSKSVINQLNKLDTVACHSKC